jgi:hypothetical protein
MDLGTVRSKLSKNEYAKAADFARDMRLIWDNCRLYNQVAACLRQEEERGDKHSRTWSIS